jgi:hypothetical protein
VFRVIDRIASTPGLLDAFWPVTVPSRASVRV